MSQGRRTRHFAQSARQGEEKNKVPVTSPLFWLLCHSLHERCIPILIWLIVDALFWQDSGLFVWNKMAVTRSCSFDDAVGEALRLFPNVPEIKEKQKKCLNLLLKRKGVFGKRLIY